MTEALAEERTCSGSYLYWQSQYKAPNLLTPSLSILPCTLCVHFIGDPKKCDLSYLEFASVTKAILAAFISAQDILKGSGSFLACLLCHVSQTQRKLIIN